MVVSFLMLGAAMGVWVNLENLECFPQNPRCSNTPGGIS